MVTFVSVLSLLYRKQKQKKKSFKTENMKTTMKQLAAGTIIAILLMVGNVQAEGTESKLSSQAIETSLHLEKWMTNENLMSGNSFYMSALANETEQALQLESWMTNAESLINSTMFSEATETGLQLENWMKNSGTWNTINITEELETEMKVENWMTSENIISR